MAKPVSPWEQGQMQARQSYGNTWATGLWKAPLHDPLYCLFSTGCLWCAAYHNRVRAMHNDMNRYICCGGSCPCSGQLGERNCPELCLGAEVVLCFPINVSVTRWIIQDEQHLMNTPCDNCLIGTAGWCSYMACLCSCAACIMGLAGVPGAQEVGEAAYIMNNIAQCLWCTVCICMQTQHKGSAKPTGPANATRVTALQHPYCQCKYQLNGEIANPTQKVQLDVRDGVPGAADGCCGVNAKGQGPSGSVQMVPPQQQTINTNKKDELSQITGSGPNPYMLPQQYGSPQQGYPQYPPQGYPPQGGPQYGAPQQQYPPARY